MPRFKTGFPFPTHRAQTSDYETAFTAPENRNGAPRPSTWEEENNVLVSNRYVGQSNRDHNPPNKGLPVRMSKPSGCVRPSMISCRVCTVVFSLLAVPSSPSFWRTAFTFCCISDFPMSLAFPPMRDKNLGSPNTGTERDLKHPLAGTEPSLHLGVVTAFALMCEQNFWSWKLRVPLSPRVSWSRLRSQKWNFSVNHFSDQRFHLLLHPKLTMTERWLLPGMFPGNNRGF